MKMEKVIMRSCLLVSDSECDKFKLIFSPHRVSYLLVNRPPGVYVCRYIKI